ncbi:MAG: hypothetical protein JXN60_05325 [Lentisphaerae bacterium]|nr:hypothetical protein [Lentisphaerota bacterium]
MYFRKLMRKIAVYDLILCCSVSVAMGVEINNGELSVNIEDKNGFVTLLDGERVLMEKGRCGAQNVELAVTVGAPRKENGAEIIEIRRSGQGVKITEEIRLREKDCLFIYRMEVGDNFLKAWKEEQNKGDKKNKATPLTVGTGFLAKNLLKDADRNTALGMGRSCNSCLIERAGKIEEIQVGAYNGLNGSMFSIVYPGSRIGFQSRFEKPGVQYGVIRYIADSPRKFPEDNKSFALSAPNGNIGACLQELGDNPYTLNCVCKDAYVMGLKPVDIDIVCISKDQNARDVNLEYEIIDNAFNTVKEGKLTVKVKEGAPEQKAVLTYTPEKYGNFWVWLKYGDKEKPERQTRELAFACFPEIDDAPKDADQSIMGFHMNGHPYHLQCYRNIGFRWSRTHCGYGDFGWDWNQKWDDEKKVFYPPWTEWPTAPYEEMAALGIKCMGDFWDHGFVGPDMRNVWITQFDKYLDMWLKEYVIPVATRLKGHVSTWEIDNEPYYGYLHRPDDYAKLQIASFKALKKINPDCRVMGICGPPGGMSYKWVEEVFKAGAYPYMDGMTVHFYPWGNRVEGSAKKIYEWAEELNDLCKKYGKAIPVWDSETKFGSTALYTDARNVFKSRKTELESVEDLKEFFANNAKRAGICAQHCVVRQAWNMKFFWFQSLGMIALDGTPHPTANAFAGFSRILDGAEFIEQIDINDDIEIYAFKRNGRHVAAIWGTYLIDGDYAKVKLPLKKKDLEAFDKFGNSIPLNFFGDVRLRLDIEPIYIREVRTGEDYLLAALKESKLALNKTEKSEMITKGPRLTEAKGEYWTGFSPIDISSFCNRGFKDDYPRDGKGGWTDEGINDMRYLPPGEWVFNKIPFKIINPTENGDKSCVILYGHEGPDFPKAVKGIKVDERFDRIHVLHTAAYVRTRNQRPLYTMVVNFKDGSKAEFKAMPKEHITDWYFPNAQLSKGKVAWAGPNEIKYAVAVFQTEYVIEKHDAGGTYITSIDLLASEPHDIENQGIPVVIAITGGHAN